MVFILLYYPSQQFTAVVIAVAIIYFPTLLVTDVCFLFQGVFMFTGMSIQSWAILSAVVLERQVIA